MTRDRDLERTLEGWLTDGPARMPDHVFDAVIERVDRTPQRRLAGLATRYLNMPSNRIAAVAATVVIAVIGIGVWAAFGPKGSTVGGPPTPSLTVLATVPSPSPSPAASVQPIADGLYALAPMQVSDLIAMINANTKLTAAEKTFLIETAFAMKDGKTITFSLDFNRGRFVERQDVDGVVNIGTQGTFSLPDDRTLILNEQCDSCPPLTFRLSATGDSFRLQMVDPPTKEVDAVPIRVLFESGPYTRQR
jgi:hypothetical protein